MTFNRVFANSENNRIFFFKFSFKFTESGRVLEAGREGVPIGLKDRGVMTPPAPGRAARLELLGRLAIYVPDRGGEDRL